MIKSGFFNSIDGDRKYNADDLTKYWGGLMTSGVLANSSSSLQVIASTGMNINVLKGKGFIDSRWIENTGTYSLTLAASDTILDRIDAIIMKLDLNENVRSIVISIKKGVASSTPVAPTMERSEKVQEYCLATVKIRKRATTILQSDITDTRANTKVCGWVTGLITQVDTSTLFLQWQKAYEDYFAEQTQKWNEFVSNLTDSLNVSTYIEQHVIEKTVDVATNEIYVPDAYEEGDIIQVFKNGLLLDENEYEVETDAVVPTVILENVVPKDNEIKIIVLKSKIGIK